MSKNSAKSSAAGNRKTGSPAGKTSVASILTAIAEPKRQKLPLWNEWNENEVNAEKWDSTSSKAKDPKGKPTSAPISHGFEDSDPKFEYPYSIQARIDAFKRPSELFEKLPVVVDEHNMDNFDLITPNEHLHTNETFRWIISQIHTLWDICKKDPKKLGSDTPTDMPPVDLMSNKATAAGRLWRPWEHIYALNKVVKGPFIPPYNQHGKYVVRLYFMGSWRKIIIDDLIPVDDKGTILLPCSTITGELWPMLLTKALMKIISLDLNNSDSPNEFNDVSIVSCFTGWLPEPLPLRFGHINEVWKFLNETLPRYQWPENEKMNKTAAAETEDNSLAQDASDAKEDLDKDGNKDPKGKKTAGKPDVKQASGKDTKLADNKKDKKDDKKDKKGKSTIDELLTEENFAPDFPEMVVFASFTDLPLNKLSASTEVADRRERLRQYNLNHDFSNPVWITCTRDITLNPPPPPEIIPVWKTIRQKKRHVVPSDEPIPVIVAKPDQWVELKSPYVGYKSSSTLPLGPTTRSNSRFSRMRSRPQSGVNIQGINEVDEFGDHTVASNIEPEMFTQELNKSKLEIHNEKLENEMNESMRGKNLKSVNSKQAPSTTGKRESLAALDGAENVATKSIASSAATGMGKNKGLAQSGVGSSLGKVEDDIKSAAAPVEFAINEEDEEKEQKEKEEEKNKLWMDFDDFSVCFKSIIVYHKPSSFKFNEKYNDLRQVVPQNRQAKKEPVVNSQLAPLFDEKSPKLLFVDSLLPIELIISFASLSRWYEQRSETSQGQNIVKSKKTESIAMVADDTISVMEPISQPPLVSGYLMAEPYLWKSLVTGQPLLRIHTTAIRSSFLSLPPGRHVLKFMISAPTGYHINVLSNTKFSLGDEEEIMPKLTDESCRFVDQALMIMKCLADAVRAFNDPSRQKQALAALTNAIGPLIDPCLSLESNSKALTKKNLHEHFKPALYELLNKALPEAAETETFAWRVLLGDATTKDPFNLREKRPETSMTGRGSAKPKTDKKKSEIKDASKMSTVQLAKGAADSEDERPEYWKQNQFGLKEVTSAIIIQSHVKAHFAKRIFQARIAGSPPNALVTETLKKCLIVIEQNLHENSLLLFRSMFKANPSIMQYYSFYKDEWNRISYIDYNGSYPEQPANNWLVLFRDVFYANEQCLLLPKIYCNLNNCLLRVINNDTYQEIPKVFNKVSPYTYTKNRRGYTIIAESREQPSVSGRWRLRLIGSSPQLIAPKDNKTEICYAFETKEIRDYFIPNENQTIMRYKVTVTEDHLSTMQITTSKADVYIKLSVYDNGELVTSVLGKGIAQIPAVIFHKDRLEGEGQQQVQRESRPSSKTQHVSKGDKSLSKSDLVKKGDRGGGKRSSSQASSQRDEVSGGKASRSNSRQSITEPDGLGDEIGGDISSNRVHKYIVEAVVLKESWPLSSSHWDFVNKLKEAEKQELKVFSREEAGVKVEKSTTDPKVAAIQQAATAAATAAKNSKAPTAKAGGKGGKGTAVVPSRPVSSAFDVSKPHWTLKWVSDETSVDCIEVKKDVDRIEEIKSLKRAWESVEAGRGAKAMAARMEFLKLNQVKVEGLTDDEVEAPEKTELLVTEDQANQLAATSAKTDPKKSKEEPKKTAVVKESKNKEKSNASRSQPDLVLNENIINTENEEILLQHPPTPPKPKVFLPPIDPSPFIKSKLNEGATILKDEEFIKAQDRQRKQEITEFMQFKDQMLKFREEEKKYRLYQKLKQIEECERLQSRLDKARKEFIEPREAFRNVFLDAERKRLEENTAQEMALASQAKMSDGKDKGKKGSAGKDKKKK